MVDVQAVELVVLELQRNRPHTLDRDRATWDQRIRPNFYIRALEQVAMFFC